MKFDVVKCLFLLLKASNVCCFVVHSFVERTSLFETCQKVALRPPNNLKMELDQNTLIGIGAGVGGLALGIGLVAFTENQGIKTSERGLDEGVANKLQAKLLEDFEVEDDDVSSVTDRMRKALQKGKTDEELKDLEEKKRAAKKEAEDDGW
mmetsp:Transcript_19485/g.28857  ORF Transcript_19485/g.28857 Transcript_19485/m.28857 type:complete len:151 (-) Transcript_19485:60-512(-)